MYELIELSHLASFQKYRAYGTYLAHVAACDLEHGGLRQLYYFVTQL